MPRIHADSISSGWNRKASLTTALPGANNDLVHEAVTAGSSGNSITVQYVVAGADTPLSVSVTGNAITVNSATDAGGLATSTAAQVAAAIAASGPASALITSSNAEGNDGTGVITALAATPLTGGESRRVGSGSGSFARRGPFGANQPGVYGGKR